MSRLRSVAAQALAELAVAVADGDRLARGRTYQRKGFVQHVHVEPGAATIDVRGSGFEPYSVSIAVREAGANVRDGAGEDPSAAVPGPGDIGFSCTCLDWGDPCKHGVAALLELAREVDDDAAVLLRWRGIEGVVAPAPEGTESLHERSGRSRPTRPARRGSAEDTVSGRTFGRGTGSSVGAGALRAGTEVPAAADGDGRGIEGDWAEFWGELDSLGGEPDVGPFGVRSPLRRRSTRPPMAAGPATAGTGTGSLADGSSVPDPGRAVRELRRLLGRAEPSDVARWLRDDIETAPAPLRDPDGRLAAPGAGLDDPEEILRVLRARLGDSLVAADDLPGRRGGGPPSDDDGVDSADDASLGGPSSPDALPGDLGRFFSGPDPDDIASPPRLDLAPLDGFSGTRIPVDNIDAAPILADALETIAEYWLGR